MMFLTMLLAFTCIFALANANLNNNEFCSIEAKSCKIVQEEEILNLNQEKSRYIFYDVNPPEGFNLRRDVYMRMAVFAHGSSSNKKLIDKKYKMVLPPWSYLYHWKQSEEPEFIPWSQFFDLESLKRFAPVIEMHEFFDEIGVRYPPIKIDKVYVLQHYQDMFETGNFEDRMSIEPCQEEPRTSFYFYDNVTSDNIQCLSFHGQASQLADLLEKEQESIKTIMIDHAEVALHDLYGSGLYWKARRSMRFNKELVKIAEDFRKTFLNSSNEKDGIFIPENWEDEKPKRNAKGGPYLSVHLRRRDFVYGRRKEIPSLENAAEQIKTLLKKLSLKKVFIATDAPEGEYTDLKLLIEKNTESNYSVYKFKPNTSVKAKYKDGGIAIIDQIICSHAAYFVGSAESTFSFRIQEEREIFGFPWETTFNKLCPNSQTNCQRPSVWKIVF